jgi:hypothetical protein
MTAGCQSRVQATLRLLLAARIARMTAGCRSRVQATLRSLLAGTCGSFTLGIPGPHPPADFVRSLHVQVQD